MKQRSTVLIVDDQPMMRETIAMMLAKQAYRLEFAENGEEALKKAAQLIPDLVLLDIMMPGMDGFEVCRRLRAHPILAHVPIIMVTALTDRDYWLQGIDAGADDFVFKPFDTAELRTRVRNITTLNRYRRLLVERLKFEWVIRHADDGYLMLDDTSRILYANPLARHYLGLPADDKPVAGTFLELAQHQYHFEPREAWADWPTQDAKNNRPRYLVRPETATAKSFWLEISNLKLPPGADVAHVIRLRDVTEKKVLQRDIWRFQSMIFHKLRTPLTVILGSLELLSQHAHQLSADRVAEITGRALVGVQRLHAEVEDVLQYLKTPDVARPGEGFSLAELDSLVKKISADLGIHSVELAGLEKVASARVKLSARAMETALTEILENSKKFHPQHTPVVQVFVYRLNEDDVAIWLGDNGLTLSPEQLTQVWTPYYQGEKQFTGEVAGMGLGLPMVASLVWSVGGSTRMYNRTGGSGVVVELVLPMQNSAVSTQM
ncbi:MAG: response regulator [Chloroflexi bacterium]|nr:response regulator [Chloroflexota bacterium]MCI0574720.1 response regulator [Chloroflexota bacterium]MCI0646309.1 response regulator [Chloroflexota bacterium]MCI0730293.1 response regulator [Chloroflexota bacterium]